MVIPPDRFAGMEEVEVLFVLVVLDEELVDTPLAEGSWETHARTTIRRTAQRGTERPPLRPNLATGPLPLNKRRSPAGGFSD
jgi:hypothetical protein